MHELSLAQALVEQVQAHAPPGARVLAVSIRAGPARMIVPEAMQWAWLAATDGTGLAGSRLELEILPWSMACLDCGRAWRTDDHLEACTCGGAATPSGGDALTLMSLEVDDDDG